MQPSSPAHPHMKNVTTVLDIIDKSLNSLRSPSVVDRAANNNLSSSGANKFGWDLSQYTHYEFQLLY